MSLETEDIIKSLIIQGVKKYYQDHFEKKGDGFHPGDRIPYAGRVFDEHEILNLMDAALEFWLTSGKYALDFERELARFLQISYCSLINSGSSANLLAFMALTSPILGERQLHRGDEVITVAAAFPTTITPILQFGAVPVFIDVIIPDYNVDYTQLEAARSEKTKAVMLAHTMGNPFNLSEVRQFCDRYGLWLIEDNCDALGSQYFYRGKWHYTGTLGDLGTSSFYPPHHLTMGEGGAVYTNNPQLNRIVESMRDWGRDCHCAPGQDNCCSQRFSQCFGQLPPGYDHKYVYSHFGYNLKATDLQAAIGCAQLEKLPGFIKARQENWQLLRDGLADLTDFFILPEPAENTSPSWFGFLITVREEAGFTRAAVVEALEKAQVQTRMLFAGNLVKQPCFNEYRSSGQGYRICGELSNTDRIMNQTFWIGVYPGTTETMIHYIIDTIRGFVGR